MPGVTTFTRRDFRTCWFVDPTKGTPCCYAGMMEMCQWKRRGSLIATRAKQRENRRRTSGSRADVSAVGGAAPLTWALGVARLGGVLLLVFCFIGSGTPQSRGASRHRWGVGTSSSAALRSRLWVSERFAQGEGLVRSARLGVIRSLRRSLVRA